MTGTPRQLGGGGSSDMADSRKVFESNTHGTSDYYVWRDTGAARAA